MSKQSQNRGVDYVADAGQAITAIQGLATKLGFDTTLLAKERRQLVGKTRGTAKFVLAVVSGIETYPSLIVGDYDPAEIRDDAAFVAAYAPVAVAAEALAQSIRDRILARQAASTAPANEAYQTMKVVARTSKGRPMAGLVAELKAMKKRRPPTRAAVVKQAPETAPVTDTQKTG